MLNRNPNSDNIIDTIGSQLKETYRKKKFITLPLNLGFEYQEKFSVEHAIQMTLLDNSDVTTVGYHAQPGTATLDDIEHSTHHPHYQRKKINIDHVIEHIENNQHNTPSILLSGRAGIGKSTLCHLLTYRWAQGEILNNIPAIIWLPLKSIELCGKNTTLVEWINSICLEGNKKTKKMIEQLLADPDKLKQCLFILDGYEEIEYLIDTKPVLKDIINKKAIKLITTRPHARPDYSYGIKFDFHVENIGFQNNNIEQYITHCFREDQPKRTNLIKYLENNTNIRTACYIPINLFILCYLWSVKNYRNGELTHHQLYNEFVVAILARSTITISPSLHGKRSTFFNYFPGQSIKNAHEEHIKFLSQIAYTHSTQSHELHIHINTINNILLNGRSDVTLDNIEKTGLIKPSFFSRAQIEGNKKTFYSFIHHTFQEYFAASYISNVILGRDINEKTRILSDISINKYNPSFAMTLSFIMAMVCKKESAQEAVDALWDAILIHDQDVVGLKHQELMIIALESSFFYGLTEDKINTIEDNILYWILFSIEPETSDPFVNTLKKNTVTVLARALMNAPIFSTELLERFDTLLGELDIKTKTKLITNYVFEIAHTNSKADAIILRHFNFLTIPPHKLITVLDEPAWERYSTTVNFNNIINTLYTRFCKEIEPAQWDNNSRILVNKLKSFVGKHYNKDTESCFVIMSNTIKENGLDELLTFSRRSSSRNQKADRVSKLSAMSAPSNYVMATLGERLSNAPQDTHNDIALLNELIIHNLTITDVAHLNSLIGGDVLEFYNRMLVRTFHHPDLLNLSNELLEGTARALLKLAKTASTEDRGKQLIYRLVDAIKDVSHEKFTPFADMLVSLMTIIPHGQVSIILDYLASKLTALIFDDKPFILSTLKLLTAIVDTELTTALKDKTMTTLNALMKFKTISSLGHYFFKVVAEKKLRISDIISDILILNQLSLLILKLKSNHNININDVEPPLLKSIMIATIFSENLSDEEFEAVSLWIKENDGRINQDELTDCLTVLTNGCSDPTKSQFYLKCLYRIMRLIEPSSIQGFTLKLINIRKLFSNAGKNNHLIAPLSCIVSIIKIIHGLPDEEDYSFTYPESKHSGSSSDMTRDDISSTTSPTTVLEIKAFARLTNSWILHHELGLTPPSWLTNRLQEKLNPLGIKYHLRKTDAIHFIREMMLKPNLVDTNFNSSFLSLIPSLIHSLDEKTLLSAVERLMNALQSPTLHQWKDQLRIIKEITDKFTPDYKHEIILKLLNFASGMAESITNTDRYLDILTTARLLYSSLDTKLQSQLFQRIENTIHKLSDPRCLSAIYLVTSSEDTSIKFVVKLLQLLDHPQAFIAGLAAQQLFRIKKPEFLELNEETLFYIYTKLSFKNDPDTEHLKDKLQLWLSSNRRNFVIKLLTAGFNHKKLFETLLPCVIENDIPIAELLSYFIQFMDKLDGDSIHALLFEKSYLFKLISHPLILRGFTLQTSHELGMLVINDHTNARQYKFNDAALPSINIQARELKSLYIVLQQIHELLLNNKLPSNYVGSLINFDKPEHTQASQLKFLSDEKLKEWKDTFPCSPFLILNSLNAINEQPSIYQHLPNVSDYIEFDEPPCDLASFYFLASRDDMLRIEMKRGSSLLHALTFLASNVPYSSQIRYLDLSGNNLTDTDIDHLISFLSSDSELKIANLNVLKLSHNNLTHVSLCALLNDTVIGDVTNPLKNLRYLFIDNNKISFNESEYRSFIDTLRQNKSLLHIDVSNNFLPTERMETIDNPRKGRRSSVRAISQRPHNYVEEAHPQSLIMDNIFSLGINTLYSRYDKSKLKSVLSPTCYIHEANAVLCVVANKTNWHILDIIGKEHAYLLIEDIDTTTGQRRILRADLYSPDRKTIQFVLEQISIQELEDYIKPQEEITNIYEVKPEKIKIILNKIMEDQAIQNNYTYAFVLDDNDQDLNCAKWLLNLLRAIDIHVTKTNVLPSRQFSLKSSCTIL